jgi:hypothetical protein
MSSTQSSCAYLTQSLNTESVHIFPHRVRLATSVLSILNFLDRLQVQRTPSRSGRMQGVLRFCTPSTCHSTTHPPTPTENFGSTGGGHEPDHFACFLKKITSLVCTGGCLKSPYISSIPFSLLWNHFPETALLGCPSLLLSHVSVSLHQKIPSRAQIALCSS